MLAAAPEFDRPRLDRATAREALALLLPAGDQYDDGVAQLDAAAADLDALAGGEHILPPLRDRLVSLADAFDRFGVAQRSARLRQLADATGMRRPPGPPGHGGRGRDFPR